VELWDTNRSPTDYQIVSMLHIIKQDSVGNGIPHTLSLVPLSSNQMKHMHNL